MKNIFFVWLTMLMLISTSGFTQEKVPLSPDNRFSARLEFGFLGLTTNSATMAVDEEDTLYDSDRFQRIDSLGKQDSNISLGTSFFLFDINYLIRDNILIYVGTPFFDDSRKGLTFGAEKLFQDQSILGLSIFVGGENSWKDPYVINMDREVTYSTHLGTTIEYDGILGSELNINYTFQGLFVEDDVSGDRIESLARDGVIHTAEAGYRFFLTEAYNMVLTPSIFYTFDHRKGEAYRKRSFGTELDYTMEAGNNIYTISGAFEKFHYSGLHPVFNETRSEEAFTVKCFYTRKNLMNSNWYTRIGGVYESMNSNIDFFKQHTFYYGISLGYTFE